jgi:hypothetical protein
VDAGNKSVEPSFGIAVGKETDIFKFPAEDCEKKKIVRDWAKKPGDPRLEQAAYYR